MNIDQLFALTIFAASTVFTPGPNNIMLMTSGANFGFRRTLPHMAGVAYGFPVLIVLVGMGVMALFDIWPLSYTLLKVGSVAYVLYLAWKIANAGAPAEGEAAAKPLTFMQAAAFQWVNPKAWSMALGAITLFATERTLMSVLLVALVYAVCGSGSAPTWAAFGTGVRRFLQNPVRLRIFNVTMALLLIAAMLPVLLIS